VHPDKQETVETERQQFAEFVDAVVNGPDDAEPVDELLVEKGDVGSIRAGVSLAVVVFADSIDRGGIPEKWAYAASGPRMRSWAIWRSGWATTGK
jgi:hypothetical protein